MANFVWTIFWIVLLIAIALPILRFAFNICSIIFNGAYVTGVRTKEGYRFIKSRKERKKQAEFLQMQEMAKRKLEKHMSKVTSVDCVWQVFPLEGYEFGVVIRQRSNPEDFYGEQELGRYTIEWEYEFDEDDNLDITFPNIDIMKGGVWFNHKCLSFKELVLYLRWVVRNKDEQLAFIESVLQTEGHCTIYPESFCGWDMDDRDIEAFNLAFKAEMGLASITTKLLDATKKEISYVC